MKAIREIMVPLEKYPRIHESADIREAISMLRSYAQSSKRGCQLLVVYDHQENPAGLLTLRCLLMAVGIRALINDVWFKAESWSWYFLNRMRTRGKICVREVMRPIAAVSIEATESLSKAAFLFASHGINFLPVTDRGKVIGIIEAGDILNELKNNLI